MSETQPSSKIQQIIEPRTPVGHTVWSCSGCSRPVATSWLFCENCGTDFQVLRPNRLSSPVPLQPVVVQVIPVAEPGPSPVARRDPLTRIRESLPERPSLMHFSADTQTLVKVIGGFLVLLLVVGSIAVFLQTRDDLHRTEGLLGTTQQQLTDTKAELAANRTTLAATKSDLNDKDTALDEA